MLVGRDVDFPVFQGLIGQSIVRKLDIFKVDSFGGHLFLDGVPDILIDGGRKSQFDGHRVFRAVCRFG